MDNLSPGMRKALAAATLLTAVTALARALAELVQTLSGLE